MSESSKELFDAAQKVLLRCWLMGFFVLLLWLAATVLMGDSILEGHGSFFGLTRHELDLIFYCGMSLRKLTVIACFFIPWLAIRMVLKRA